jgi:hypothetical protein
MEQKQPQTNNTSSSAEYLDVVIQQASHSLALCVNNNGKNNEIEKATGVLAQDGLYAFYVFCKSKSLWEQIVEPNIGKLIKCIPQKTSEKLDQSFFEELASSLHDMLFFKEVIEQLLVYTRYHLKAMDEKGDQNG